MRVRLGAMVLAVGMACGLSLLAACTNGDDTMADQLGAATVVAENTTTPTSAPTSEVRQGLRVTVYANNEDVDQMNATEESTTSSVSSTPSSSTTTAPTTTATTATTSTSTTAPTTATSQPLTTAPPTTSATTSTAPSTSDTTTASSTTTAPTTDPPQNNFPDVSVLRLSNGQTVSFASQVAGQKPVLVWFWLPG